MPNNPAQECSPIVDRMWGPDRFHTFLGIGRRTFQTWRALGKLPDPDLKIGRVIRWRESTIHRWVEAQKRRTHL